MLCRDQTLNCQKEPMHEIAHIRDLQAVNKAVPDVGDAGPYGFMGFGPGNFRERLGERRLHPQARIESQRVVYKAGGISSIHKPMTSTCAPKWISATSGCLRSRDAKGRVSRSSPAYRATGRAAERRHAAPPALPQQTACPVAW